MSNTVYSFVYVPDKVCKLLENKNVKDFLMKWSMKGNFQVQYYSFNQPFQSHQKEEFVNCFFSDPAVYSTLIYSNAPVGKAASSVYFEQIPCTILSMDFFDRLVDPENEVVRCDQKSIVQCQEEEKEGFLIDNNLRQVILNEESKLFNVFNESDRKQFLWKIFCHLCLGGEWCQYEFLIEPYLIITKDFYKEVVSVERVGDTSELVVRSVILKVQALDEDRKPLIPSNPSNIQNFFYLSVDPFKRSVIVISHSYGTGFWV